MDSLSLLQHSGDACSIEVMLVIIEPRHHAVSDRRYFTQKEQRILMHLNPYFPMDENEKRGLEIQEGDSTTSMLVSTLGKCM